MPQTAVRSNPYRRCLLVHRRVPKEIMEGGNWISTMNINVGLNYLGVIAMHGRHAAFNTGGACTARSCRGSIPWADAHGY